ncbi:MAG TPA: proton-conducting transporter membrane subunit [Longimicrobiales bacterium]|nr:proton-conducting transporter membrane subunit [Longimicrobiales bacterium]
MSLLLVALLLLILGTVLPLLWARSWRHAHALGAGAALAAAVVGVAASVLSLGAPPSVSVFLSNFPVLGPWSIRLDGIAAVFLLLTFVVSGAAAVFATGYLRSYERSQLANWLWPCFNLLVAAIVVVLVANSVLLFLLAWEAMTLASFVLVILEHEKLESRKAAWLYLLASHVGTAFLIAFFALNRPDNALLTVEAARTWLVLLPLLGFGIKAGIVPLHVWLPEAHPAAPSHVSAVMSGAMVPVGIYGLFRVLSTVQSGLLAALVILLGALTAVTGAIQAIGARRVKRLLAYSTVENSGIMLLGMGVAVLAATIGQRDIVFLASAAVLTHALAHAAFKGALFLGAGTLQHAAGTGDLDGLSGWSARLPHTAGVWLIASLTAVAAPPGAAFVSEFMLYLAAIRLLTVAPADTAWVVVVLLVSLAFSGACALAAFVKLYGVPFLGRARESAPDPHDEWTGAKIALWLLGTACLLFGVFPSLLVAPAGRALAQVLDYQPADAILREPLAWVARLNLLLIVTLAAVGLLLAAARRRFGVRRTRTWNCGFSLATPRTQYTATSLVDPLTQVLQPVTGAVARARAGQVTAHDPFMRGVYRPISFMIAVGAAKVRRIQHGRLHWYLVYIFIALVGALLIEFWG